MNAPMAAMAAFNPSPGADDAAALAAMVRDSVATGVERQLLRVAVSRLDWAEGGLAAHHQRLVVEAMAPLLRSARSRLYSLPNGDLVAAAPPNPVEAEAVAGRLRMLLAAEEERQGPAGPAVSVLRLPEDAIGLMVALEDSVSPAGDEAPPKAAPLSPACAADAASVERAMVHASVASFLRWRPVVRLTQGGEPGGGRPVPQWIDWRLDLPALSAALLPGRDIAAAPALKRRVAGLLDRRLLAELARPDESRRLGAAGLALGLAALAAPEFRRFDEALGLPGRAKVVICLDVMEALADPTGFLAARTVLVRRGFRLALDLPDGAALPLLGELGRLGVDYVRLPWRAGLSTAAVTRLPKGRVVLMGADRPAAIAWGWEAGVALFEGRMLQR